MLPRIFYFFLPLSFIFITGYSQETKIIKFKQQPLRSRLQNYYIAGIKDDRSDTTTIGSVRAGLFSKKYVPLNLPGGAAAAFGDFLKANLTQDTRTIPIILHIAQLEVAEKAVDAFRNVANESQTTLIVPANMSEVSTLIASAMKMIQAGRPAA